MEDNKELIISIIGFLIFIILLLFATYFGVAKMDIYTTEKKIELYQEKNIIDEDTKKILVESLGI